MQKKFDWKKPEHFSILVSFLAGLAVHMFGLVNTMHNPDDISMQPGGFGVGLSSGRWFLECLGRLCAKLLGGYNLPWLNGILFLALIAVSVGFLVSTFDVQSHKIAAAIGLIFITYPSVTATMMYRFTVVYYGLAILLAILAVWFLVKYRYGFFLSVLCTALALGIYQAYLPLSISLLVLYLLKQALQHSDSFWHILRRGFYFCGAILLGVLLYVLILQIFLRITQVELNSYQGINEIGKLSIKTIPHLLKRTILTFFQLPKYDYAGLAQTKLLKIAYIVVGLSVPLITAFLAVIKKKGIGQSFILLLLVLIAPVAVNFIMIMCPDGNIHTLMVYAFAVVPCVPLVLTEAIPPLAGIRAVLKSALVRSSAFFVAVIFICNSYMANVNYTATYYTNRQAENYFMSMVTQIKSAEGFDAEKKWAVIGTPHDPNLNNAWQRFPKYEGHPNVSDLTSTYLWWFWAYLYGGYQPPLANAEEALGLQSNQEVINMPCWPAEGSIKVVDDYIVIKYSE